MAPRAEDHEDGLPLLLDQILSGNSEALGELYVAFAEDVLRAAHRVLGSAADAEDITGEVFVGMSAALQSYNHGSIGGFRRWLEKITVRRVAAHANRRAAALEVPLDSVRAPAARWDRPIDRLALVGALATLPPALRTVFELKAVEGHSHQEISTLLGISVGASRVRLHRARRELRLSLGDGP